MKTIFCEKNSKSFGGKSYRYLKGVPHKQCVTLVVYAAGLLSISVRFPVKCFFVYVTFLIRGNFPAKKLSKHTAPKIRMRRIFFKNSKLIKWY